MFKISMFRFFSFLVVLGSTMIAFSDHTSAASKTTRVTRVLDGDSIIIASGERLELLGVDAPEKGECYAQKSQKELTKLLSKKEVRFKARKKFASAGNPSQAEIYVGSKLINQQLIRTGYAKSWSAHTTGKQSESLKKAEQQAQIEKKGLWSSCTQQSAQGDRQPPFSVQVIAGNFSLDRGDKTKVVIQTAPMAYCSLSVKNPTRPEDQVADKTGLAIFEWSVESEAGTWPIVVTCSTDQKFGSGTRELFVTRPL